MLKNRLQAGRFLGKRLKKYKGADDVIVLGVPRGGIITALSLAKNLSTKKTRVPWGAAVTKKIPAPGQPELAIGVVDSQKNYILNKELIKSLGVDKDYIERAAEEAVLKAQVYEKKFKTKSLNLKDKIVIIVDDGAATGYTALGAVKSIRAAGPKKIILALPVLARETVDLLKSKVEELVYLKAPKDFYAVGQFYEEFKEVSDERIMEILRCD